MSPIFVTILFPILEIDFNCNSPIIPITRRNGIYFIDFLMLIIGCRSTIPGIRLCKSTNLNAHDQKISKLLSSFGCFPDCSVVGRGYQLSSCWPAPEPGPPHKPLAALEYRQSSSSRMGKY